MSYSFRAADRPSTIRFRPSPSKRPPSGALPRYPPRLLRLSVPRVLTSVCLLFALQQISARPNSIALTFDSRYLFFDQFSAIFFFHLASLSCSPRPSISALRSVLSTAATFLFYPRPRLGWTSTNSVNFDQVRKFFAFTFLLT